MQTSNPTLSKQAFSNARTYDITPDKLLTLGGIVNKTLISISLCIAAAVFSFSSPKFISMILPLSIIALIMALVISFKQSLSPMLVPAYACIEGLILGSLSAIFEKNFNGIVFQAITITFSTLICMLLLYKSRIIQATNTFKKIISISMISIFFFYLITLVLGLFGVNTSFAYGNGLLSIGISFFVVAIASFSLILDFDFIENATASHELPKYMEWYSAFSLLVTLVWLYMEILRLLSKLQSRE